MLSIDDPIIPTINSLIEDNPGTVSLGQGVVHYPPPSSVKQIVSQFWSNPEAHVYGASEGEQFLHDEIFKKLAKDNNIDIDHQAVVVTAGSNMAFLNTILAISDPGDEIILFSPYYFNQEMAIRLCSCVPILVETDHSGKFDFQHLIDSVSIRTRAIVTVSPNNPTGAVYSEEILRSINEICCLKGIYHISDEAYEYFLYEDARHFSPGSISNGSGVTVSLFSLSKSYGFASWRIGYAVIPEKLLPDFRKVQDTNLICPTLISQHAAAAALEEGPDYCRPYIQNLANVRTQLIDSLNTIDKKIRVMPSSGAFYLFLELPDFYGNDFLLAKKLIESYKVAVIPGSAFGVVGKCNFRVSYGALEGASIISAWDRLVTGLSTLT